jgi:hypothetical protein
VYSIQHYVIKFVSDLWQVGGFIQVLRFSPPITLTATYNWNIVWKKSLKIPKTCDRDTHTIQNIPTAATVHVIEIHIQYIIYQHLPLYLYLSRMHGGRCWYIMYCICISITCTMAGVGILCIVYVPLSHARWQMLVYYVLYLYLYHMHGGRCWYIM